MRKTYTTPAVVATTDAVLTTKSGGGPNEIADEGPVAAPGSVGFYL